MTSAFFDVTGLVFIRKAGFIIQPVSELHRLSESA